MIVDIFIPCHIDQFRPETGFAMVKILEKVGCTVHYNPEQTCCGKPAFDAGFWDDAKTIGDKFIREFLNDRYIVSPSDACVGFIRNRFQELFHNSALHNEFKQVQKNLFELGDFLINVLRIGNLEARFPETAVLLESCSGVRAGNSGTNARTLLRKVKELNLVEYSGSSICCGFGGPFSVKFDQISSSMASAKMEAIMESGANYIIGTEYSCLMHLDAFIRKHQYPVRVVHLAEVLASGWSE
jgi:L-lactate dehydrogenase complex protein LldE